MSNQYERKNNSATLFTNSFKDSDKHPDMKGEALIGDVVYKMSAWRNSDKNGNDYYSMKFQTEQEAEKYKKENASNVREQADQSDQSDNSDLPF